MYVPGCRGRGAKIGFRVAKKVKRSIGRPIVVTTFFLVMLRVFMKSRGAMRMHGLSPGAG